MWIFSCIRPGANTQELDSEPRASPSAAGPSTAPVDNGSAENPVAPQGSTSAGREAGSTSITAGSCSPVTPIVACEVSVKAGFEQKPDEVVEQPRTPISDPLHGFHQPVSSASVCSPWVSSNQGGPPSTRDSLARMNSPPVPSSPNASMSHTIRSSNSIQVFNSLLNGEISGISQYSSEGAFAPMSNASIRSDILANYLVDIQQVDHTHTLASLTPLTLDQDLCNLTPLGRGGCGIVYQAEWRGAHVAAKLIVSDDGEKLQHSVLEAIMGRMLAHPHVVHTYAAVVIPVDHAWMMGNITGIQAGMIRNAVVDLAVDQLFSEAIDENPSSGIMEIRGPCSDPIQLLPIGDDPPERDYGHGKRAPEPDVDEPIQLPPLVAESSPRRQVSSSIATMGHGRPSSITEHECLSPSDSFTPESFGSYQPVLLGSNSQGPATERPGSNSQVPATERPTSLVSHWISNPDRTSSGMDPKSLIYPKVSLLSESESRSINTLPHQEGNKFAGGFTSSSVSVMEHLSSGSHCFDKINLAPKPQSRPLPAEELTFRVDSKTVQNSSNPRSKSLDGSNNRTLLKPSLLPNSLRERASEQPSIVPESPQSHLGLDYLPVDGCFSNSLSKSSCDVNLASGLHHNAVAGTSSALAMLFNQGSDASHKAKQYFDSPKALDLQSESAFSLAESRDPERLGSPTILEGGDSSEIQGCSAPLSTNLYAGGSFLQAQQQDLGILTRCASNGSIDFCFGKAIENDMLTFNEALRMLELQVGQYMTCIVMEYCDRGSLAEAIKRQVFMPSLKWGPGTALRALIRTAQELAQGLAYLHSVNIVHGDLKPANVLLKSSRLDRRGFTVRLSDFGYSSITGAGASAQGISTLAYTAPEAVEGPRTPATDVWSFGVILYEMITGQQPFLQMHWGQLLADLLHGQARLQWPATLHPVLRRLGEACTHQDPSLRPSAQVISKVMVRMEESMRRGGSGKGSRSSSMNSQASPLAGPLTSSSLGLNSVHRRSHGGQRQQLTPVTEAPNVSCSDVES